MIESKELEQTKVLDEVSVAQESQEERTTKESSTKEDKSNEVKHKQELMKENEKKRLRIRELEKEVEVFKNKSGEVSLLQQQLNEIKVNADQRVIAAELRNAAKMYGLKDISDLKLFDTSVIKVSEDGTVEGIAELLTKAKESKPYLFEKANVSTSANFQVPPPSVNTAKKDIFQMTARERDESYSKIAREIAEKVPTLGSKEKIEDYPNNR